MRNTSKQNQSYVDMLREGKFDIKQWELLVQVRDAYRINWEMCKAEKLGFLAYDRAIGNNMLTDLNEIDDPDYWEQQRVAHQE